MYQYSPSLSIVIDEDHLIQLIIEDGTCVRADS